MIALFTDFGVADPYVGQLHAVLARAAPGIPVIDLFHSVPDFNARVGAYLLPAYASEFSAGTVFLCVVDPGVGGLRQPVMLKADGRWYVGPDNGLFEIIKRRSSECNCRAIRWRPARLSASFHGRDLFAPVAAQLACGIMPDSSAAALTAPYGASWPDDLAEILYVDHYGNCVTGLRALTMQIEDKLRIRTETVSHARVYSETPAGSLFWYENANGLVEIAVNGGRAQTRLGVKSGDGFEILKT